MPTTRQLRHRLTASAAIIAPAMLIATPAQAQQAPLVDAPPIRQTVDENGVDMSSGRVLASSGAVSIGGSRGLAHRRIRVSDGWRHNYLISAQATAGSTKAYVDIGGARRSFTLTNGVYLSDQGTGERLTVNFSNGQYVYTARDGTYITFLESLKSNGESYYGENTALASTMVAPDGTRTNFHYKSASYEITSGARTFTIYVKRLQSVTNSNGYQLQFRYHANGTGSNGALVDEWYRIFRVTAINNAVEYCDPQADNCGQLTNAWPYIQYDESASGTDTLETITDNLSRTTQLRFDAADRLKGVKRPIEASEGMTAYYGTDQRVARIDRQGKVWREYTWSTDGNGNLVAVSTDDLAREQTIVTDDDRGLMLSHEDALGRVTEYEYDGFGRLKAVELPEDNRIEYELDGRGNTLETTRKAKPNSSLADIVTSAVYPANCANTITCNKPTSTTDALGNTTDYSWSSTHGALLAVEGPAPAPGEDRPRVEYLYNQRYARYYTSAGNIGQTANPTFTLSFVKRCRTATSCSGTANEQVVTLEYQTDLAIGHNLQPIKIKTSAGDGSLLAETAYTYHRLGSVASIDGPLPGSGDTVHYRYDVVGQRVGTIGPDPDGAGPLPNAAERITYNADGQVTKREIGRTLGTSDTAWNGFGPQEEYRASYDAFGRLATSAQVDPGSTTQYWITQYGYDGAGRLECTAQRMGAPTTATPLPASACSPMAVGQYGPDRIAQNVYDVADQVTEVWSGVGSAISQKTAAFTYRDNGQVLTMEDANGNRTRTLMDGHDRVREIQYPSKATPGTVDATDTETVTYDANGNILTHTTRMNETFVYAYDDLGRVVLKTVPERSTIGAEHTRDVAYEYDLAGAMTVAEFTGAGAPALTFAYDALGRLTSSTSTMFGPAQTIGYQYDVAGRRTRITHPDGQYFTLEYDTASRWLRTRENGSANLAQADYNNQGRLAALVRNGASSTYNYDNAGRVIAITHDFAGSSFDHTSSVAYNRVNKVASETAPNDTLAFDNPLDTQIPYTANGLNQYTSVDGSAHAYDGNGNLVDDDRAQFFYDTENRLIGVRPDTAGGNYADLLYDPFGRLVQVQDQNGGRRRILYDGDALIAEHDGANQIIARYVHGPGAADDPLVWYEGGSVSSASRRLLFADRIGSIVAVANAAGGVLGTNTYDEYGLNGPTGGYDNSGRFRYTGQAWVPEAGLYYYKARMYSPGLGRFMQTDPIGYADGMNLYRYVGNDPVNLIDPSGLAYQPTHEDRRAILPKDGTLGEIVVIGNRPFITGTSPIGAGVLDIPGVVTSGPVGAQFQAGEQGVIVVTGKRPKDKKKKEPQSGQCASPGTSSSEAAAARAGNRDAYWSSRLRRGDPLAATALGIVRNNTALGVAANTRLISAIVSRNGANPGRDAINREVNQIGIEIMQAHVAAVNQFGSPTSEQVAQYHFDIFRAHGLPASTFGGAPLSGSQTEAGLTSGIWMGGC